MAEKPNAERSKPTVIVVRTTPAYRDMLRELAADGHRSATGQVEALIAVAYKEMLDRRKRDGEMALDPKAEHPKK